MQVVKRNESLAPFQAEKIERAIVKAMRYGSELFMRRQRQKSPVR